MDNDYNIFKMKTQELLQLAKPMRLARFLAQRSQEMHLPETDPTSYNDIVYREASNSKSKQGVVIEFDETERAKKEMDWEDFPKHAFDKRKSQRAIKTIEPNVYIEEQPDDSDDDEANENFHKTQLPPLFEESTMKNLIGKQYIRKPTIFKSYYLEKDPDNARTIHGNIRAHHSDVLICPDCGSHFRRNKSWHHVRTLKHQTVVQAAHKMMEAMTEIQDKCKKLPRKYRKIL